MGKITKNNLYLHKLSIEENISGNRTWLKYFLSYFLLLSVLFVGFFFAVRIQLESIYAKELRLQTEKRLENIQWDINSSFLHLNQVQSMLTKDIDLILSRSSNDDWYLYNANNTLIEYTVSNNIIDSICYVDLENNVLLSTGNHIKRKNSEYYIFNHKEYISFPLMDYLESSNKNQLLYLKGNKSNLLIYLPFNDGIKTYSIFYILDVNELSRFIDSSIIPGISSICLVDAKNNILYGDSPEILETHLSRLTGQAGFYPEKDGETIYALTGVLDDNSLLAVLSNQSILDQVTIAFRNTYLIILLLGCIGILFIGIGMRVTYWPLHKLTYKLIPSLKPHQSFVDQLDNAFTNVYSENQKLQYKIDSYRLSMQKSLLDSIVVNNTLSIPGNYTNIDRLFCMDPDSILFMVKIQPSIAKENFPLNIKAIIDNNLPGDNPCMPFESTLEYAVFLIYYTSLEPHKEEVLHHLLTDLYQTYGYYSAMSNSANSPLEIPSLYENVTAASRYWPTTPVVSYSDIKNKDSSVGNFTYPYAHLEQLTSQLSNYSFMDARKEVEEILILLDKASSTSTPFPDMFTQCVLIDVLTVIVTSMNRQKIKFKLYSDLYFATLYLCRSCLYTEKRDNIHQNMLEFLDTYETEYSNLSIHTAQIEELVRSNYTSLDFSISTLADTFHVSIAYMSYLFKNRFNENFSDYLWKLRMEKAKAMLSSSNITIDEISISVGYLNTSSFRRKFKQETGLTPSAFRGESE